MTQIMTPSKITDGQINKAVSNYRALLENHRGEMFSEPVQQVLGQSELASEMLGVLRRYIKVVSNQESLDACGRKQHTTKAVVDAMPRGSGEEMKIVYFKPDKSAYKNGLLSCMALDAEYKNRGLVPDPQTQIDDNAANPEFADTTPNACLWKDDDGNWCYVAFYHWDGERRVDVHRNDGAWGDSWVFAGVSAS